MAIDTIDQVTETQTGKEVTIDELFDALRSKFTLTIKRSACVGLTFAVYGGPFKSTSGLDTQTVTLLASTTSYIEADATTGALHATETAYTTGRIKLGVAITSSTGLTSFVPADRENWSVA